MRRLAAFFAVIAVTLLAVGSSVWAHVSVSPSTATKGGFATLTFQVPNEEESANTTKVQVKFPDDNPIADVSVQPVAGWTVAVAKKPLTPPVTTDEGTTLDESVDTITWTAASGGGVEPGEFQQFLVSVGLPAEGDELVFPTVQTYSDGTTVQWIQTTTPGGREPEHPAPVVTLTDGSGDGHEAGATTTTVGGSSSGSGNVALPKDIATTSDVDSAKTVGIIGIVVGGIGVILGAIALIMGRRRPTT